MRTRISGGWVVGHNKGTHRLDRGHEVVFEGDNILYVGPKFEGRIDREIDARGKLVSPGFIDAHVHSGHRASHRLISDTGRGDYFGQPFFEISVPKEGTRIDIVQSFAAGEKQRLPLWVNLSSRSLNESARPYRRSCVVSFSC